MNFSADGPRAQFSHQVTRLQFPKDVHFGDDISIWIAKVGDVALGNMYLRVDWPVASPVDDSVGTRMIDFVELRSYEGELLERHYGESLELMNDLSVTTGKQQVLTSLLGKGLTSNLVSYYIRMPFRLNLPLCALDKPPVFRVRFLPSLQFSTLNWTKPINVNLFVDYVYVTKAERDYFKKTKIDYLTHTMQRLQFIVDAGVMKSTFMTEFTRPVKELYWVIQTNGASSYDFTNSGIEQLTSLRLQFNGIDVISPEFGTPLFLRTIQGLENHTRVPDRKFYMYTFALDPEHPTQPTGSVNMSAITRQYHELSLSYCVYPRQIRVYAVTHNIVRVANGKVLTVFDTVQEGGTITASKERIYMYNTPAFTNPGPQSFALGGSFSVSQTASATGNLTWSISPTTGVTLTSASTSGVTVVVSTSVNIPTTSYNLTATNPEFTSCVQTFSLTNIVPLYPDNLWTPSAFSSPFALIQFYNSSLSDTSGSGNIGYITANGSYSFITGGGPFASSNCLVLPAGSWIYYSIGGVTIPVDNGLTISFWAKYDAVPGGNAAIFNFQNNNSGGYYEGFNVNMGLNSFHLVIWKTPSINYLLNSDASTITSGVWYNFVISIDNSKNIYMYQNGQLKVSGNYSSSVTGTLNQYAFQIGGTPFSSQSVQTEYADIRIYTGAAQAAAVPVVMAATAALF